MTGPVDGTHQNPPTKTEGRRCDKVTNLARLGMTQLNDTEPFSAELLASPSVSLKVGVF